MRKFLLFCFLLSTLSMTAEDMTFFSAGDFKDGIATVSDMNVDGWAINTNGEKLLDLPNHNYFKYSEGLFCVSNGKKDDYLWGVIDIDGNVIVPRKYDYLGGYSCGFSSAKKNGKYTYIDRTGKTITTKRYDYAKDFQDGYAVVELNDKYGVINSRGEEIIPCKYDDIGRFSEGFFCIHYKNEKGYRVKSNFINTKGEFLCDLIYSSARPFSEGLAAVRKGGKEGYINTHGEEVIPFLYESAYDFKNGLAVVSKKTESGIKWGCIDSTGILVVPFKYASIGLYSDGLMPVKLESEGKYGYIDAKGNVVISMKYDYADDFVNGLAKVKKDGKYGFIDTKGRIIVPFRYDDIRDFSEGYAAAKIDKKWYYVDMFGEHLKYKNSVTDMSGRPVELSTPFYNLTSALNRLRDKDRRYAHPIKGKKDDVVVTIEILVNSQRRMTSCEVKTSTSPEIEQLALQLINDFNDWLMSGSNPAMDRGWPVTIDTGHSNNIQVNVSYKIVMPLKLRSSYYYNIPK